MTYDELMAMIKDEPPEFITILGGTQIMVGYRDHIRMIQLSSQSDVDQLQQYLGGRTKYFA